MFLQRSKKFEILEKIGEETIKIMQYETRYVEVYLNWTHDSMQNYLKESMVWEMGTKVKVKHLLHMHIYLELRERKQVQPYRHISVAVSFKQSTCSYYLITNKILIACFEEHHRYQLWSLDSASF